MAAKPLEAGARRPSKTVDALVVVSNDERLPVSSDQLDQALLRQVQVLVLIDQHVRKARAIKAEQCRLLVHERHRQCQQIFEIEQPLLAAGPLVSREQPDARLHELHALGKLRVRIIRMSRSRPGREPPQRDELLLEALEHLKCRRDQVVGPFVAGEHRVAELPHQLATKDPALGPREDPEARRYSHEPAIGPQPAKGYRVEGPDRRRWLADEVLDSLAHLRGRPFGERHHQDRGGRGAARHQPAEALCDYRGLSGSGSRHDAHRATTDRGGARLLQSKLHIGPSRLPGRIGEGACRTASTVMGRSRAADANTHCSYLAAEVKAVQTRDDRLGIQPQLVRKRRARGGHHEGARFQLDLVTEPGRLWPDESAKC